MSVYTPASGTVTNAWKDAANAYASVTVAEAAPTGAVEYEASTPLTDQNGNAKTAAQLKADLAAAVTAKRIAQFGGTQPLASVSGTLSV